MAPFDQTFLDIRVTHPNCRSNAQKSFPVIFKQHESEKAKYNDRILNDEKSNFTPLFFLATGGMSTECKKFLDRLAELYAAKRNEQYHVVVRYIRTKLRFAPLCSCLIALRGFRGKITKQYSV